MCPVKERRRQRRLFDLRYVPHEKRKSLILACLLFWSVLCFLFLNHYVIGTMIIQGASMDPTLVSGERRLIYRWAYQWADPQRGEIVAFRDPYDDTLSVKRIIALPGETIQIQKGTVHVNGDPLVEPYLESGHWTDLHKLGTHPYQVDPGHYFVMGDNRKDSEDSRDIGGIARESIIGKIP